MKKLLSIPAISLLLSAASSSVLGQELNLFQAIESSGDEQEAARRPQRAQQANQTPAFTLVGTSRFGEKYVASLLSRDNQHVTVEWGVGKAVEILGYREFSLVDVKSRTATINFPESETCIENEAKGVKCNGSYALLSLTNAEPLAQQASEPAPQPDVESIGANSGTGETSTDTLGGNEIVTNEDGTRVFRNPFSGEIQELPVLTPEEQAERDARRQRRAEQFRNFEIVRIPDDDIPEGMQRVRTPFGDTLEPIEE